MLAWKLFRRAATLILDNLGAALRVSALPYAILAAVTLYFAGSVNPGEFARIEAGIEAGQAPVLPAGYLTATLVSALAQVAAFLWIAVAWHRYILLTEGGQSWIPTPNWRRMLGYLGRSMLIGLIVLCIATAVMVAVGVIAPAVGVAVATILSLVVGYRLGLILPAGAIDKPITVTQAWVATKGQSGTVVLLAILTFLVSLLLSVPTLIDSGGLAATPADGAAIGGAGPVAVIYSLVISWILLMLGVSVLSTLYGHFIERRPLD